MRELSETGFLRLKQILPDRKRGTSGLIPVCPTTWWQGIKSGKYPKPLKLGPKTTVWRVEDIRALIEKGVTN